MTKLVSKQTRSSWWLPVSLASGPVSGWPPALGAVGVAGGDGCGAGGVEGVADDGLEHVDIVQKPAPAFVGDPAQGLGTVLVEPFPDFDEAGLVQDLEVPAEVAIGQVAEFLEVGEDQAAGVGDQR